MISTASARRGIAVAPHSLAAQSALAVLREGGNAIEATVAAAATIPVVYPHMTGVGGDAFWLIAARGALFYQKSLAATLKQLVKAGLRDFYRGDLARSMANDLAALGSPLALADLEAYAAREARPLELPHSLGRLYNMTPPTQGVVSLAILGILERLGASALEPESAAYAHAVVEATKAAFLGIRDPYVADPAYMAIEPQALLDSARLDMKRARPWGGVSRPGGTTSGWARSMARGAR